MLIIFVVTCAIDSLLKRPKYHQRPVGRSFPLKRLNSEVMAKAVKDQKARVKGEGALQDPTLTYGSGAATIPGRIPRAAGTRG